MNLYSPSGSATPTAYARKFTPKWLVGLTLVLAIAIPGAILGAILFLTPLVQPETLDAFTREVLGKDPATWWWRPFLSVAALALVAFVFVNFGAIFSGVCVWYERRVAGRMQSRIGPNRQGAGGFLVWIADAVKMLLKEDLIPEDADRLVFRAAPYFVLLGFALTLVVLPFGQSLAVADLNVGIVYITSITALVVVGVLLAGWASNSKWALFGGMRSAAQVISYEIPAGIAIFVPVLMAGTLSLQGIASAQGGLPWEWFIFRNPAAFIAFFILFTSQLAESNRTPFDLPEAESELVAGYLSEFSGFRFALIMLAEYGNLWVISALSAILFLGGWQIPGVGLEVYENARGAGIIPSAAWFGLQAASMAVLVVKAAFLVNVIVWLRWTLPRIRVDQMMALCWKYLVPAAFACFVFTLLWMLAASSVPQLELVSGYALTAVAVLLAALFVRQIFKNVSAVRGDKLDLSNW
jgi:NADH-quinone oxidoreductase subunit H